MTKRFHTVKLLPAWLSVSAVVIVAGIILFALLGFNFSADRPVSKTFEVIYDTPVLIEEDENGTLKTELLKSYCEESFKKAGLSAESSQTYEITNGGVLEFTFAGSTSDEALMAAKTALADRMTAATENGLLPFEDSEIFVSVHTLELQTFGDAQWRGAVALAVGAIVALVYIGVRFGIGGALTGLAVCAHDALFTLALLAICRIPLTFYAPLLYAALAAALSLVLWGVQLFKMRENFKDPAYRELSAAEAVEESGASAWKIIIGISASLAVVLALTGGLAAAGVRSVLLPALIAVAACTYSSLLLAPAIHAHVKKAFDRAAVKRKRYDRAKGKKEKVSE